MDALREMNHEVFQDVASNAVMNFLNIALTSGAATVNNQNAASFKAGAVMYSKSAAATAITTVAETFAAIADGKTVYANLLIGSDAAWTVQVGTAAVSGAVVPDPEALDVAIERSITSVSSANPAVVTTSANHLLKTGDEVWLNNLPGLTINGGRYRITRTGATTFTLNGVNGGAIGTYSSGGAVMSAKLNRAYVGTIKVVLSGSSGFTFGTTNWDATGVTATFTQYTQCPVGEAP